MTSKDEWFDSGEENERRLPEGDMHFFFDGGKQGNSSDYFNLFTGTAKILTLILLHKCASTVQARRGRPWALQPSS